MKELDCTGHLQPDAGSTSLQLTSTEPFAIFKISATMLWTRFGHCFQSIETSDKLLLSTGRITSLFHQSCSQQFSVVISFSASSVAIATATTDRCGHLRGATVQYFCTAALD
jgi:hypothetical protein